MTDLDTGLRKASLGPIGIPALLLSVGGWSDRALDIAVRYADGWHAASDVDPGRFAAIVASLDERCDAVSRPRLRNGIQLQARDPRQAPELLDEYRRAGANVAVFVLRTEQGPDDVRRLAESLGLE